MVESHELHQKKETYLGSDCESAKTEKMRAKELKKCKNLETHKKVVNLLSISIMSS